MLRLCYSNHFEELALALCDDLREARRRSRANLFASSRILVPNHNVTAYLKFAVAQRTGIAANLEFQFFTSFIAACVPPDQRDIAVLDTPQLHALLCSALADEDLLADDDMAPVREYLYAGGTDEDAVDMRRFQLAEQLATLFSDYRLSRAELVSQWKHGLQLTETNRAGVEIWERRLWLSLFDDTRGLLRRIEERTGTAWVQGPELFERRLVKDLDVPRQLYVFGFSYLPWAHHRILALLARFIDLHVYALNPCMEFWEDLRSGWEARLSGRQMRSRDQAQAQQLTFGELEDTPPLRLWGRPGRENIRILNEQSQCDFDARFVDPTEGKERVTMLTALQRDILFRQPTRSEPDPEVDPGDDSIQILGCPSVQRELEIIGNEIWALMARDPSLRFNDIAVLLSRSSQELYQAHIPAVFGELHHIPYHMADGALVGESRMIEALELLLDLPFGRFTRPELLRLLTHPSVLARYPDVDPSDWVHWSERLGIVHGADHDDHLSTYIERDLFNWQQGIRRLALGAFMAGEPSGENRPFRLGEAMYLPEELAPDLLPSAARFSLIARSLINDARYCRTARKPLAQWRMFLDLLTSSYLAPANAEDERHLAQCREAIASLASSDLDGRPVSYRIACELLRLRLRGLRGESGEYLAHGVTVAPLLPMRPIPYRIVFMAGLGEGEFPASERESPLDLRAARRRRGDVSPRERDRYLFLETLLGTRERLYVSYVSRDDQTGETLQPSAVVMELGHMLRRGYAHDPARQRLTMAHPLRRYDPRYFPALFAADTDTDGEAPLVSVAPAAHRQANALALRRHLEQMLRERGLDMPSFDELRKALTGPRFAALRARLGLADLATLTGESTDDDATVSISLAMVRRFLESPLQAWASAVLRLRESELEDLVAREDEAFATPVAPMVSLLREVFGAHLAAGDPSLDALLQRYHQRSHHLELTGRAPTGVFSDIDKERHVAVLRRWHEHVMSLTGGRIERVATYSFGRAREHADAGSLLPPILLTVSLRDAAGELRPVRVELFGHTEPVAGMALGSLVLNHGDRASFKHALRGMVDQLALSAAGIAPDRPHMTTVLTTGDKVEQHRLEPWSQDEAVAHLSVLIADLLGDSHEYLLPCEAVFERLDKPDRSLVSIVEGLKSRGMGYSCLYGPISQLDGLDAPDKADALIERRFGPFLSRLGERRPGAGRTDGNEAAGKSAGKGSGSKARTGKAAAAKPVAEPAAEPGDSAGDTP